MLYCLVDIEGLTMKMFKLETSTKGDFEHQAKIVKGKSFDKSKASFSNSYFTITLQKNTLLKSYKSKSSRKDIQLDQEFNYFDNSASGLYIFKPLRDKIKFDYFAREAHVFEGNLVTVIRSKSNENLSQQITLFKQGDTQIAPLIDTTAVSWEFIELGFSMSTKSFSSKNLEYYNHDSNEFVKREFENIDDIKDTGKNIYPVVHGYALKDGNLAFGIVNNYPTGCGFIKNDKKEIECFLARSTSINDDKGVPDNLKDDQPVTFSYFLMLDKIKEYSKNFMVLSDYFNLPLTTKYHDEDRNDSKENEIEKEEGSMYNIIKTYMASLIYDEKEGKF